MSRTAFRDLYRRIESHNPARAGHGERVAVFAVATGYRLGMTESELAALRFAAALHDAGKLHIEREVLESRIAIEVPDLVRIRQRVCGAGFTVAGALGNESLAPMIDCQYERFDGLGFPGRLSSTSIPLGARIIHAATALDAMSHDQPWRASREDALEALERESGTQFDPAVVDALRAEWQLIQAVDISEMMSPGGD